MFWDFKFTVKNQNLPKCRIVAEFFYETPIRALFRGFQTNCTTRVWERGVYTRLSVWRSWFVIDVQWNVTGGNREHDICVEQK